MSYIESVGVSELDSLTVMAIVTDVYAAINPADSFSPEMQAGALLFYDGILQAVARSVPADAKFDHIRSLIAEVRSTAASVRRSLDLLPVE